MIIEKYKQEVIDKLQKELEQTKRNGSNIQYWLENSNAFNAIKDKKEFLYSILNSLHPVENMRVEESERHASFVVKCNLGDILLLDVERKSCIVKLGFLEKGYWVAAKEDLIKSNNELKELINKKENPNNISLIERIKVNYLLNDYMKRNNDSLEQIKNYLASEEKTINLFDERNKLSIEVNILVDKFTEILNESQYKITNY
jgi:hypothetical protein